MLEFRAALAAGDPARAVECYRAPFLDGFFLDDAPEFDQWASRERGALAAEHRDALETLAETAEARQDDRAALQWWRALLDADPYNTHTASRLMQTLEHVGDRGNALQLAQAHEELLRRELGAEPDIAFQDLVRRLRESPRTPAEALLARDRPPSISGSPAGTDRAPRSPLAPRILAGAAVALLAITFWLGLREPARPDQRVLVLPLANETGDSTLDGLGRVASDWVAEGITRAAVVDVVEGRVAGLQGSATMLSFARQAGAAMLVSGSYHLRGDSLIIRATVTDVTDGEVLAALPAVAAHRQAPMVAVDSLQARVTGSLAALLDPRLGRTATAAAPPTYAAYLEYLTGVDLLQQSNLGFPYLYRAAQLDTSFSLAMIWAAFALTRCQNAAGRGLVQAGLCAEVSFDSLVGVLDRRRPRLTRLERHALDFVHAWHDRDQQRYYESARAAADLVPVSFWSTHAILGARDQGRMDEALSRALALRDVEVFDRVWPDYRGWLTGLFHDHGQYDEEVVEAYRMSRGSPSTIRGRLARARAFAALGQLDSAFAGIEPLLENPSQAVALASELRHHGHTEAADSVTRLCADRARRVLATNPSAAYWQAECFRLTGAGRETDSILATLHDAPQPFQPLFLHLSVGLRTVERGETVEARRQLQALEALAEPSPSPSRFAFEFEAGKTHFQARLAAALGERELAVRLLERYLELQPRLRGRYHYRGYPEFDALEDYPPFRRLVARQR